MNEEILEIFYSEAEELIEAMEVGLLALEKTPEEQEHIHSVFRAAHTMKGNAATIGLDHLVRFAHMQENILDLVRKGRLNLTSASISLLLESVDVLRSMIRDQFEGRESDPAVLADIETRFYSLGCEADVGGGEERAPVGPEAKPSPPTAGAAGEVEDSGADGPGNTIPLEAPGQSGLKPFTLDVGKESLEDALFADMHVFAVWITADEDLKAKNRTPADFEELLGSYGRVLASDFHDDDRDRSDDHYHAFLASILDDAELVALALDVFEDRLFVFDSEDLEDRLSRIDGAVAGPAETPEPAPAGPGPRPEASRPPEPPVRPSVSPRKIAGIESIRVNVDLIDTLMNLAGELVLGRNQLCRLLEDNLDRIPGLRSVSQHVDMVTSDIQAHIMKMRMQPLANVLGKFPRLVRDLSLQLGKEIDLIIRGGEVELDKSILEALSDPLTHLIRNAVDHGIEPPDERLSLGKSRTGSVSIRAFHEEGQVNLTIEDDGRGISPDRVIEKAASLGLIDAARVRMMNESEKLGLIFLPGFSLADRVTDVSGRGVGMDVVKTNIESIGGHLEIDSAAGQGATIRLRLPLTLAIIPSLVVSTSGQYFAIPQMDVAELVCVEAGEALLRIEKIGEADVLRLREKLLPLVRLADVLGFERKFVHPDSRIEAIDRRQRIADRRADASAEVDGRERRRKADRRIMGTADIFVVVLRMGPNRFGLVVDELMNNEEIVVKPLQVHLRDCKVFSGTTIMGDGTVAMILSASGMAEKAGLIFGEVGAEERRRQEEEARRKAVQSEARVSIVLFNYADDEYFALPLAGITRLERLDPGEITRIGDQEFATFRGTGLPLIRLENHLPVNPAPLEPDELFVIIPRTTGPPSGILASRIVDTVDTSATPSRERVRRPGLDGSAIVEGHLTMFLNAEELMELSAGAA